MKLSVLILAFMLTGCAAVKTVLKPAQPPVVRVDTVEVKVPVFTPIPPPPVTPRPALAIYSLTEKDKEDPGKVALLYQATVKQLQGYALQLEAVIAGYDLLSKGTPK